GWIIGNEDHLLRKSHNPRINNIGAMSIVKNQTRRWKRRNLMARKDDDIEFQAQVAAWLFDKMNFKQEQIAEHLGIRQPDVSRRLKLAEERGWLSRPTFLRGEDITAELLQEIEIPFYQKLPELRRLI